MKKNSGDPALKSLTKKLFSFLEAHHSINAEIQRNYILEAFSASTVEKRALLLMHKALNTQSQPNLGNTHEFFEAIYKQGGYKSFSDLCNYLKIKQTGDLVEMLATQKGWGPKTAALFVRNLGIIQATPSLKRKFWTDVDVLGKGSDHEIRLPVDAVIEAVFSQLSTQIFGAPKAGSSWINRFLLTEGYDARQMLIWDDLWFWGFITQNSQSTLDGKRIRQFKWNEAKYWAVSPAPKDALSIRKIKTLSGQFLKIVAST